MEKQKLIQEITDIRRAWEETITHLGNNGLEQPGFYADRRVRDLLTIFNGWDRWNLVQLRCAFTGEIPAEADLTGGISYPGVDTFDIDAMNAMFIASTREMPVDEIVRHWQEVSSIRAEWVSAATQNMLDEVVGADWKSKNNRLMRLASEVPSVENQMPAWKLIYDQVDLQLNQLQIVRNWMDR